MDAPQVIESLLQLGVGVKDAYTNAKQADGTLDWARFLRTSDFKKIEGNVQQLVGNLTETDIDKAIDAVRTKETALLAGVAIADLPAERLLQYSDLLDIETALVNRKVKSVSASAQALQWVVEDLLPVLVKVAKVVIPLLL
jgi:hypothetical protein